MITVVDHFVKQVEAGSSDKSFDWTRTEVAELNWIVTSIFGQV